MEKIVIFDVDVPGSGNNKIFDRNFAYSISHTLIPFCYLYEEAKKQNIHFITTDIFLNNFEKYKNKKVYLMSHLFSKNTRTLLDLGVVPLLMTCQESPFIAGRFYMHLKKYSSLFKYVMLYPGMKKQASSKTIFIPMYLPEFYSKEHFDPYTFEQKKYLTYIASNKDISSIAKTIIIKFLYGFSVKNIYHQRKKLIAFFSQKNDFDLYGRGWGSENSEYIKKVYKGEVIDKEKKLREYKFVLCLENSIFPGYITEKIFDCFFAQTIPVYLGAPDVEHYIPKNTFISISDFKSIEELDIFLRSMNETTYKEYLSNIEAFLKSENYTKFSHEKFAVDILSLISHS